MKTLAPRRVRFSDEQQVRVVAARRLAKQALDAGQKTIETGWRDDAFCGALAVADKTALFFNPFPDETDHPVTDRTYYRPALAVCAECEVATDCLAEAILEETLNGRRSVFGVRGGMMPRERIKIGRVR